MSLQVDGLAVGVRAERLGGQVDVHAAGQRVGDDQRRRGEVVGAGVGVDPALEVAVAREHRADDQVLLVDRRRDLLRQRAGVPDAGGAAVADEVELELVQVLVEPGLLQVLGDHGRARRERGLDPGLALAGPRSTAFLATSPAPSITEGFEVLVQLVIAAITTWPWSSSTVSPSSSSTATASPVSCARRPRSRRRDRPCRGLPRLVRRGPRPAGRRPGRSPRSPRRACSPSSSPASGSHSSIASRKAGLASVRGSGPAGASGPAMLGTTSPRSSSSVSV